LDGEIFRRGGEKRTEVGDVVGREDAILNTGRPSDRSLNGRLVVNEAGGRSRQAFYSNSERPEMGEGGSKREKAIEEANKSRRGYSSIRISSHAGVRVEKDSTVDN